jgi:two-component system alkaline phosphatase synthesis response regulator PhoP
MALKILAIDDDPEVTKLTSLLLKSYGMDVLVANSGAIGVEMVRRESPDLVMLDMMMPEMDGIEVCQVIRSFSNVPILAYSAFYDLEEITRAKSAGVNDYLQKPTPSNIIVEHINRLIKKE